MDNKILLIGSGPAAFAASLRLLKDTNLDIYLIDGGGKDDSSENNDCMYMDSRENDENRLMKLSNKNLDHNFKKIDKIEPPLPSLVFGGYSNVWGGVVSPLDLDHYKDWGEEITDLLNGFREVGKYMKLHSNSNNTLYEKSIVNNLPISNREEKIYRRLLTLKSTNLSFDYSCLAFNRVIDEKICTKCGEYSWSCNNRTVWSPKRYFSELIAEKKITYLEGSRVSKVIRLDSGNINAQLINQDNKSEERVFNKVFLGAGAIGTSKIIVNSPNKINTISLNTNDLVSIPYLAFYKGEPKKHTFSDLFIKYSKNKYHSFGQLYGFSNNLLQLSREAVPLAIKMKKYLKPILKYSGGIFLYLDQKVSSTFIVKKEGENEVTINRGSKTSLLKAIRILTNIYINLMRRGIWVIPFVGTFRKYGSSNHYGSQFAMRTATTRESGTFPSDELGRIINYENLHIIDSSVLPLLPSGPITYTVMANSYRITDKALNDKKG